MQRRDAKAGVECHAANSTSWNGTVVENPWDSPCVTGWMPVVGIVLHIKHTRTALHCSAAHGMASRRIHIALVHPQFLD